MTAPRARFITVPRAVMLAAALALGLLAATAAAAAQTASTRTPGPSSAAANLADVVSSLAPKVVRIKYVLKITSSRGEAERQREVGGLIISDRGEVLTSNFAINPYSVTDDDDVQATPSDIRVLIGDDTEGLPARLVSTDRELDLAWLTIEQAADPTYEALSLDDAATPGTGDTLVAIERMGRIVDRVPKIMMGVMAGPVTKPRKLYMTDGLLGASPGTLVVTPTGRPVGLIVLQLPDADLDEQVGDELRRLGPLVLPIETIRSATQRVKSQRAEDAAAPAQQPEQPEGNADSTPAPGSGNATPEPR